MKIAPGHKQCGGVKQRRQKNQKDQLGIKADGTQSWEQRKQQSANDQHDRKRNWQLSGQQRQCGDRDQ